MGLTGTETLAKTKHIIVEQPIVVARISLSKQRMNVYVNGVLVYKDWKVSTSRKGVNRKTGKPYETPTGTFIPNRLEVYTESNEFDDAPMPHAVFYDTDGRAIHGTDEVRRLGKPVSHGCIRLAPANAKIFFYLVQTAGLRRTRVLIDQTIEENPATSQDVASSCLTRRRHPLTAQYPQ
jgi:lipoprotein-anchoring transpeptidase ErfK/SrfK